MKKELITYKGQTFEVLTFETEVILGSGKELQQIETLLKEERDTKAGRRLIKPVEHKP